MPKTKRANKLQGYIANTLGVSLESALEVPVGVHRHDWIIENTFFFYNQLLLLKNLVNELCTESSCKVMTAGSRYEYIWKSKGKPTRVSALEYFELLAACKSLLIQGFEISFSRVPSLPLKTIKLMLFYFKSIYLAFSNAFFGFSPTYITRI